jgi:hypothetical protein
VVEVLEVSLPGAIYKGEHPGAMIGGERLFRMRSTARPPYTLTSGDESAMKLPEVVRKPVQRGDR